MNKQTSRKRIGQDGFTLVELMIVVAIIGILAVLAIFGVGRYITNAKTGEARNSIGQIAKSAVAAYQEERAPTNLLAPGTPTASVVHDFCLTGTSVPVAAADVTDKKYQSSTANWGGDQKTGWKCLRFVLTEPQYFQYSYTGVTQSGFNGSAAGYFSSSATTPTNGFSLGGALSGGQVVVQPQMVETVDAAPATAVPTVGGS